MAESTQRPCIVVVDWPRMDGERACPQPLLLIHRIAPLIQARRSPIQFRPGTLCIGEALDDESPHARRARICGVARRQIENDSANSLSGGAETGLEIQPHWSGDAVQ